MAPIPNTVNEETRPNMSRPQFRRARPLDEGDSIVVSGMSGRFPKADNVAVYGESLYNKLDMVDDSELRWTHTNPDIPKRCGRISKIDRFDATFFGVHYLQADVMDPQCRTILEEAYQSVMDAGINPISLRGSQTGVYIASCFSESEKRSISDPPIQGAFAMTGCSRAMYANRISYSLGLHGPSVYMDTACSSSMYCLDMAYSALRNGEIDAAIVGGTNLILHPNTSLHFARLGVLSMTSTCLPFDQKANGYIRSEGVAAIFLQRQRDAFRIYGTLVHSKTNCDGFKSEGITYPSGAVQEKLLREFYNDVDIAADDIGYIEAHSTGTVVGDPQECRAIDNAICRKRSEPLFVGSVKGNIGHTEPVSGICSVIKVLLLFQSGKIPPQMNFTEPRKEIDALIEGRIKVITEITELKKPYVGVNSFGFGGANAHALFKQFDKKKTVGVVPEGSLPRLLLWSSRTNEAAENFLQKIESKPLDSEHLALLDNIQTGSIPGMVFRGYSVLKGNGTEKPTCFGKEVLHNAGVKRPIVWVFSGMGSQWPGMGAALMAIPQFRNSIQRCHNALKPSGVDLIKVLTLDDPKMFDNIMHSFIGIAAIQVALTDVLRALGMEPDYIIGHSTGELGCAYADGCFTAEQMILAAYYRGKVSIDKQQIKGSMAAVGLSYKAIRGMLPESIEVACHNGPDSCTISGPADDVACFVDQLKAQNIFAREVPCSDIAYHTRYISHMGADFLKYLKHIIPNPTKRSKKWLSTSVLQKHWVRPESQLSSAEYHTNNLLSSVYFEETSALLPRNALTIEVAPHGLLQSILKSSIPTGVHVGLTQRNNKNNHMYFLSALGKLYVNGLSVGVDVLYPKVEWPVSRGTATISDLIEWDHRDEWDVYSYYKIIAKTSGEKVFYVDMKTEDGKYLEGHNIDGKVLVPGTYYLECVWRTFAGMHSKQTFTDCLIEFENVKFLRATTLTIESKVELTVMIHYGTGSFEIIEGDSLVCSGTVSVIKDATRPAEITVNPFDAQTGEEFTMSSKDFYTELKLRGYHYSKAFKSVESLRGDGQVARLKWISNWVSFMDCMLQTQIVRTDSRELCVPTKIDRIRIFGRYHLTNVSDNQIINVYTDPLESRVVGGGVEIIGMETRTVQRRKPPGLPVLERYQFIPHLPSPVLQIEDISRFFVQLALENDALSKLKFVEIIPSLKQNPIIEHFLNAVEDLPLITGDYKILNSHKYEDLLSEITDEDGKVSELQEYNFVIDQSGGNVLQLKDKLVEKSYLVLVLNAGESVAGAEGLTVLATCPCAESGLTFALLRKNAIARSNEIKFLKISSTDTDFKWLREAQHILHSDCDLVVFSENEKHNGIMGLTNCLRREYIKKNVRCVLIDDLNAPPFDPQHSFYASQLAHGMAVNVFRKGQWGSYRHLRLPTEYPVAPYSGHVYGNILHRGDMSTLKWLQGRLNQNDAQIKVVYSSLNFKDIMLTTGRISATVFGNGRLFHDCVLGFEFAGVDLKTGKKVMGMCEKAAVANYIDVASRFILEVPEHWSLREAATVPAVYITVYYTFFWRTDIRKGKSILIHAGTGGIGLASIRTAFAYGLEVFTTVSTAEKKNFLLKTFPQLKERNIGNSRDISFEAMIRKETNGRGVDFVLNSLAEEKLLASVRCVAEGGVFLEIGKFDMSNDNPLGMAEFLKEISFVAVLLDLEMKREDPTVKLHICELIKEDIAKGIIQPLPSTVFPAKDMEQAFRYLASSKHIGKVLIQVCESEKSKTTLPIQVLPMIYFSSELVYVVPGGLGGFGLELVDWMVLRGARKIVLSSSRGISNGYQSYRIQTWRMYGCEVRISQANIATRYGCEALLRLAMIMGPVGGIFNLAVVLKDAIFENQTVELFNESLAPKALATKYLDELSRSLCPNLQHFVVFSSSSCGRGNAGQTNYGMANSIMERIIEDRNANYLPGKAIQWGAIGEVGLVANMTEDKIDLEIGGTLPQRISSCLKELDTLLSCPDPLVASMVIAEKKCGTLSSKNLLDTVMNIMSIRDAKSVSFTSTLSEIGMDSLMAVDIKQTLERDFDLFLSLQDLRSLTLQKLQEYSQNREQGEDSSKLDIRDERQHIAWMVRSLGDESNYDKTIVPINHGKKQATPIFFFPGIEGTSGPIWISLADQLDAPAYVIQLQKTATMNSYDKMGEFALKEINSILKPNEDFRIVAYSYGSIIATKVAYLLEKQERKGRLFLVDGSPWLLQTLFQGYKNKVGRENVDTILLSAIVNFLLPDEIEENCQANFGSISSFEGKLLAMRKYAQRQNLFSEQFIVSQSVAALQRGHLAVEMDLTSFKRINAPIILVKPTEPSIATMSNDYDLNLLSNNEITIKTIDGNHFTILENPQLPQLIEDFFSLNRH